jgi:hypothetical protein
MEFASSLQEISRAAGPHVGIEYLFESRMTADQTNGLHLALPYVRKGVYNRSHSPD